MLQGMTIFFSLAFNADKFPCHFFSIAKNKIKIMQATPRCCMVCYEVLNCIYLHVFSVIGIFLNDEQVGDDKWEIQVGSLKEALFKIL